MFFVSHLYFGRVKRPSSGWMAVTSITHHYNMITNKFENLHALQRKINTRALLPDARSSRPILAVKKVTYIQALRLNTVQPIGPLVYWIKRYRHLFASAIIRLRCIRPKQGCLLFCPRPPTSSHSVVVNSECASARSQLRAWLCGDKWASLTALLWRLPSAEQTLATCEYLIIASYERFLCELWLKNRAVCI